MQLKLLKALAPSHGAKKIVTIDGPAGAGKTTLAEKLLADLRELGFTAEVVHMDDLYNGWSDALSPSLSTSLNSIVAGYKNGEVSYRRFNWKKNSFDEVTTFSSPEVLILEGVGSGQRAIRSDCDLAIWIEADPEVALQRVIARDGDEIRPFLQQWSIDQAVHFESEGTAGAADYCLDGAP